MAIQWYRANDAQKTNRVAITGATKRAYTTTPADEGKGVFRKIGDVESNVIFPVTPYPINSIPNTRLAVLDFESMAVGTHTSVTDSAGNTWTLNGATSFSVAEVTKDGVTRRGLQLTGTGFKSFRSADNAKWKKLHDGTTDFTTYFEGMIGTSNRPGAVYGILGTSAGSNANTGVSLYWDDRTSQPRRNWLSMLIGKGVSSSDAVLNAVAYNALPPNKFVSFFASYKVAGADNFQLRGMKSRIHKASKTASTPSTANATYAMEIGCCGNGALPFVGVISRLIIFEGIVPEMYMNRLEGTRGNLLDTPGVDKVARVIESTNAGRYNSFGTLATVSETKKMYSFRSGLTHTEGGRLDVIDYNRITKAWGNRRILYTPAANEDVRDPRIGFDGDNGVIWFTVYDRDSASPTYNKVKRWGYLKSTDGGPTWSDMIEHPNTHLNGTPWGKLVKLEDGALLQPYWKTENVGASIADGSTFIIGYHKSTDNMATWTDVEAYRGTGFHITESIMVNCGNGRLVFICRNESYWGQTGGLVQISSTDNGDTWSAPVRTNMGGTLMNIPTLYYDAASDTITCLYQDRVDGYLKISPKNPVATVFASPTAWITPAYYHFNHETPNTTRHVGLGYPDLDGELSIWAKEDSDNAVKLVYKEENLSGL